MLYNIGHRPVYTLVENFKNLGTVKIPSIQNIADILY